MKKASYKLLYIKKFNEFHKIFGAKLIFSDDLTRFQQLTKTKS